MNVRIVKPGDLVHHFSPRPVTLWERPPAHAGEARNELWNVPHTTMGGSCTALVVAVVDISDPVYANEPMPWALLAISDQVVGLGWMPCRWLLWVDERKADI